LAAPVTWGGAPAHPDLDWARLQLMATGFEYAGQFRVFLTNLRNGSSLAIAARIISEHGGSLRVEDNAPVGSRFLIELPVAETPAAPATERVGVDTDR